MSPQNKGAARRTPPRRPAPKRLPAAVYWRRRAVVFGTPVVVLIAIVALFSGGGSKAPQATLSARTTPPSSAPTSATTSHPTSAGSQAVDPNAVPSGPCPASSIQVTPSITNGIAGQPIEIDLALSTTQTACTFAMSGSNVAIKILSSGNSLWTSQDCANVVPAGSITLRNAAPMTVALSWDGHQSNGSCGATNPWVGPGSYSVIASVIGSTPTTTTFSLKLPTARTITKTATPKPTPKPTAKATPTHRATTKATSRTPQSTPTTHCGDSCP